ncbi:MAG: hypothetical protein MJ071_04025 [Oscillospiraceae bacterium]|nr:hypothetical protein [Oscillospiraceae bacterium]
MKFNIKHEETWVPIFAILSFAAFMGSLFVSAFFIQMPVRSLQLIGFLMSLLGPLCMILGVLILIIEKKVGTTVSIEADGICIRHLFIPKRIRMDQISSLQIEHYERNSRRNGFMVRPRAGGGYHFLEKRLQMTIHLNNGKSVVLNDSATIVHLNPILTITGSSHEYLPDEAVPLYMVYITMMSMHP